MKEGKGNVTKGQGLLDVVLIWNGQVDHCQSSIIRKLHEVGSLWLAKNLSKEIQGICIAISCPECTTSQATRKE